MSRVELCDGLVEDQHLRSQGNGACQRQKMGLAAGKLPDIFILSSFQTAPVQRFSAPLFIVLHPVIETGIGSVVKNCRADNLILKILIYVSHLPGQRTHIGILGVFSFHPYISGKCTGNEMGNQAVQHLAKGGFATAVVADDGEKIPLFNLQMHMIQSRLSGARVCIR